MIRVVAAIIERSGRLLICRRRRDAALGGRWEFPGGKLRPSETPRQGLARELREELGIEAAIGEELYLMRHFYPGAKDEVQVRFFRASIAGNQPRNRCFERIEWALPGTLPRRNFLAGNRLLVARLARGEFLKLS